MKLTAEQQFAKRLKELRLTRGWSQELVAKKAEIHQTHVGALERGEKSPTLMVLTKLAKAFKIKISELFE